MIMLQFLCYYSNNNNNNFFKNQCHIIMGFVGNTTRFWKIMNCNATTWMFYTPINMYSLEEIQAQTNPNN